MQVQNLQSDERQARALWTLTDAFHLAPRCGAKSNLQHKAQLVSNLAQTPRRKSPTKVHGFWSNPLLALRRRDESDPHRTGMAAL
jgi:hypothetical protein